MAYTFNPFTGSFDNTPADQTLSFNEANKNLSISKGNTVSLSSLSSSEIDSQVRSLTSNWETTYTLVSTNSATWTQSVTGVAEILVAQVFNADSVTLNRGDIVYSFGATGDVMSVKMASNSAEATSSKTLGIINQTITTGTTGYATVAGRIDKLHLGGAFQEGDALWLGSTPGTFTRTKPSAPNHGVYLGVVERANNGNGIAYIKVQNGYELNEIHDVSITSVSANQILRRNSSNNLWQNTNDGAIWDSAYTCLTSTSGSWIATTSSSPLSAVSDIVAISATDLGSITLDSNTLYVVISSGNVTLKYGNY